VPQPKPPPFSFSIFLTLLTILGMSAATLWVLVRRATSHRRWVALAEWAREKGFRFDKIQVGEVPAPFGLLQGARPLVRQQLSRGPTTVMQFEHGEAAPQANPAVAAAGRVALPAGAKQPLVWNVLVRQTAADWRPTGLRPANAMVSVLDLFSLGSFPTIGGTERFVAFGTDSAAARAVSKSMLRSLLPPDVGLLLHGRQMVVDFSSRHFDAIELSRILALSDQLAAHLPASP
jgi:hypothetical protein